MVCVAARATICEDGHHGLSTPLVEELKSQRRRVS
jgi:hypothetical protein